MYHLSSLSLLLFSLLIIIIIVLISQYYNYNLFESFELEQTKTNNTNNIKNIILIGDSILNNSVYTLQNQSVPDLISKQLEKTPEKTLYNLAKDGATISDCSNQLHEIPPNLNLNETNVFISAGGNDILNSRQLNSVSVNALFNKYMELIKTVKAKLNNSNIVLLKLYYPLKSTYKSYYTVIKQWNQLLHDNSSVVGYNLLQTDTIIVSEEDIVYDIEPSAKGGDKIAEAIVYF
jgi:lysophospholipase L1-like esterase